MRKLRQGIFYQVRSASQGDSLPGLQEAGIVDRSPH